MKKIFGFYLTIFVCGIIGVRDAQAGLIITDDSRYLQRAENHSYVGWVDVASASQGLNNAFSGTGVLIDPHWVLTAAHVTRSVDSSPATTYDSFRFGLGSNYLSNPGETLSASEVFIHPSFTRLGVGYDLALLYFENPFLSVDPVERYVGDIAQGDDTDLVGFGRVQMINQSDRTFTGDRRAGNNVINSVNIPNRPEYVSTRLSSPFFPEFYRDLQMGILPGDSGGALILNGQLAGIAALFTDVNTFGNLSSYSKLDNAWIDQVIGTKVSAVPEPGSLILFSLTGLRFFIRRGRRGEDC